MIVLWKTRAGIVRQNGMRTFCTPTAAVGPFIWSLALASTPRGSSNIRSGKGLHRIRMPCTSASTHRKRSVRRILHRAHSASGQILPRVWKRCAAEWQNDPLLRVAVMEKGVRPFLDATPFWLWNALLTPQGSGTAHRTERRGECRSHGDRGGGVH